jgi:hypothetical protein
MGFEILFHKYNLREINSQMEIMSLHELHRCRFAPNGVVNKGSSFEFFALNRHFFDRKRKKIALSIEKLTIFAV